MKEDQWTLPAPSSLIKEETETKVLSMPPVVRGLEGRQAGPPPWTTPTASCLLRRLVGACVCALCYDTHYTLSLVAFRVVFNLWTLWTVIEMTIIKSSVDDEHVVGKVKCVCVIRVGVCGCGCARQGRMNSHPLFSWLVAQVAHTPPPPPPSPPSGAGYIGWGSLS